MVYDTSRQTLGTVYTNETGVTVTGSVDFFMCFWLKLISCIFFPYFRMYTCDCLALPGRSS